MTPKELRSKLKGATDLKAWVENEDGGLFEKPISELDYGDRVTITGKVEGERTLAQLIADDIAERTMADLIESELDLRCDWVFADEPTFKVDILRRAAHEMAEKAVGEAHAVLCRFKADVENLKALRRIAKGGGK